MFIAKSMPMRKNEVWTDAKVLAMIDRAKAWLVAKS